MKVKELIEKLKEFDPEAEVGGTGHFGEILEIYGASLSTFNMVDGRTGKPIPKFVALSMDSAGNAPD